MSFVFKHNHIGIYNLFGKHMVETLLAVYIKFNVFLPISNIISLFLCCYKFRFYHLVVSHRSDIEARDKTFIPMLTHLL